MTDRIDDGAASSFLPSEIAYLENSQSCSKKRDNQNAEGFFLPTTFFPLDHLIVKSVPISEELAKREEEKKGERE